MVEKDRKKSAQRIEKVKDIRSVRKFLEELSWVLSKNSHLDFKLLQEAVAVGATAQDRLDSRVSKNPNIHFLVGVLPIVFSDERYFPSNEDIASFAFQALKLPISRWEKRSRYELIGRVVCETAQLDDERLTRLVAALTRITAADPTAKAILEEKKLHQLSWNEVIQRLNSDVR